MAIDVSGKRLGLFRELVPNLTRVAIMIDPRDPAAPRFRAGYEKAAKPFGMSTQVVEVAGPGEIEPAFAAMARDGSMALSWPDRHCSTKGSGSERLVKYKMPTLSGVAEMVPNVILVSYGQDFPDFFRGAIG